MRVVLVAVLTACNYNAPSPSVVTDGGADGAIDTPHDSLVDTPRDAPAGPFWTNLVGATEDGVTLTNTATTSGWNKSGAVSVETIDSGSGFVEFSSAENTLAKICGLSNGDTNQDFKDIDFAIYLNLDGTVQVFEKGTSRGVFGNYVPGDRMRVELVGGTITYLKNGTPFFTSTGTPVLPLLGDAAMFHRQATITEPVIVKL